MKSVARKSIGFLLKTSLAIISGSALAGPILVWTDMKTPTQLYEHYATSSWVIQEVKNVSYRADGIVADSVEYLWSADSIARLFLTWTPDGEPTSSQYIGMADPGFDVRQAISGPFDTATARYNSGMVGDTLFASYIFPTAPRVWQDPAYHGLPGDGIIRSTRSADSIVAASAESVPEPSTVWALVIGLFSLGLARRYLK